MKKLRRALGVIGALKGSKDESEGTEDGNSKLSASSSKSLRPRSDSLSVRPRGRDEDTYVRYETESLASISPSVNYTDPQNTSDHLFTKLHKWANLGHMPKIKKFASKMDINAEDDEGRTPLHLCAYGGHLQAVAYFLSSGANIEAEDKDGRTPFLRAIEKGHIEVVQLFVRHKANMNAKDHYDNNAVHIAAQCGSKDLLELLLEVGLDFELPNVRGQTPIHFATEYEHIDLVKCLVSYGANPNACDKKGITALMLAAKHGYKMIAETLINLGCNPNVLDCSGWNASAYAKYCGHKEVHKWLENHMTENPMPEASSSMLGLRRSSGTSRSEKTLGAGNVDDSLKSWNDDEESSDGRTTKPKLNIPLFRSASSHSVNSDKSSLSPKNLSSSASGTGPPKPPRSFNSSPNLCDDPESEHFSDLHKMSDVRSINEYKSTSALDSRKNSINYNFESRKSSINFNIEALFPASPISRRESKSSAQEFSDITFDEDDDDDNSDIFLPMNDRTGKSKKPSISKDFKKQECLPRVTEKQEPETPKDGNVSCKDPESVLDKDLDKDVIEKDTSDGNENAIISVRKEDITDTESTNSGDAANDRSASFDNNEESKSKKVKEDSTVDLTSSAKLNKNEAKDTKENEAFPIKSCEGTLGRLGTLQHVEEIWEANANISWQDDSSVASADSSTFSDQLPNPEDSDSLGTKKRYFGDSKENLTKPHRAVSNNFTPQKSNLKNRLPSLFKLSSDKIANRKLSSEYMNKYDADNTKNLNNESFIDFLELGLLDFIPEDVLQSSGRVDKFTIGELTYPLNVEQVQNVISSLKILWNREHTMIENYKLKEENLSEYEVLLKKKLQHLKYLKSQNEADLYNFCLKTSQMEFDLMKSRDESQYTFRQLEDAQQNLSTLEAENRNLKLLIVEKENSLSILLENIEASEQMIHAWQQKYKSVKKPLPSRDTKYIQTYEELISTESQTTEQPDLKPETKNVSTFTSTIETVDKNTQLTVEANTKTRETNTEVNKEVEVTSQDAWTETMGLSNDTHGQTNSEELMQETNDKDRKENSFNESFSQTVISFFQTQTVDIQTLDECAPYQNISNAIDTCDSGIQTDLLTSSTDNQEDRTFSTSESQTDERPTSSFGCQTDSGLSEEETLASETRAKEISMLSFGCQTDTIIDDRIFLTSGIQTENSSASFGCQSDMVVDERTFLTSGIQTEESPTFSFGCQTDMVVDERAFQTSGIQTKDNSASFGCQTDMIVDERTFLTSGIQTEESSAFSFGCQTDMVVDERTFVTSEIQTDENPVSSFGCQTDKIAEGTIFSTLEIQTEGTSTFSFGCQTDSLLDERTFLTSGIQTEESSTSSFACQTESMLYERNKNSRDKDIQTDSALQDIKSEFCQTLNEVESVFSQTSVEEPPTPSDMGSDTSLKDEFTQTEEDYIDENKVHIYLDELRSVITSGNENLREEIFRLNENSDIRTFLNEKILEKNINEECFAKDLKELSASQRNLLQNLQELKDFVNNKQKTEKDYETIIEKVLEMQSKLETLNDIRDQVQYVGNINQETHANASEIIDLLRQTPVLSDILPHLDCLSKTVSENSSEVKNDLQNLFKRFDIQEEVLLSNLTQEISKNEISGKNNEECLKQLQEDFSSLVDKLNDRENPADVARNLKLIQDESLIGISNNLEQLIVSGDNQLENNLKTSFENLDITVGENFKILQTVVMNLQDDLAMKIKDIMISKGNENQKNDDSIQNLCKELKEINDTLKIWKSLIESLSTEKSALYDEQIVEAIRGGNDQALIALKMQSESILKTLEGYTKSLNEANRKEAYVKSEIERRNVETQKEICLQKESFEKQLKELELRNLNLEEMLQKERKFKEERNVINRELENNILVLKNENKLLRDENSSLKSNSERLLMKMEDLASRSLQERQSNDEISKKLYNSLQTIALSQKDSSTDEFYQSEIIRNLRNERDLEKQKNNDLLTENIRIMEEIGRQREANYDQIKNLRKQVGLKEEQIKSLEKQIIENELRSEPSSNLTKEFTNEIKSLKEKIRSLESDTRSKATAIRDLKEKITDHENERKDLDLEINLKSSLIIELKKEIGALQNRLRSLSTEIEGKSKSENDNEKLFYRIEELESEASSKQSLILNLRERLSSLGQEKVELLREISHLKENGASANILIKQKEDAERNLKAVGKELESIKVIMEQDYVPKSKLNTFYHEMESYFEGVFSNRKWEQNQPATDELKSLENKNRLLKEKENKLQIEILHLEDEVKVLNSKLSFAHYNIHLWKSKYQILFEEHYKLPSASNGQVNILNKPVPKEQSPTEAKTISQERLLQEINEQLDKPYKDSEFLNDSLRFPRTDDSLSIRKDSNSSSSTASRTGKYTVVDYIDSNFKKHLQPRYTSASEAIVTPKYTTQSRVTFRTSTPNSSQHLQESFESYVNFLKR